MVILFPPLHGGSGLQVCIWEGSCPLHVPDGRTGRQGGGWVKESGRNSCLRSGDVSRRDWGVSEWLDSGSAEMAERANDKDGRTLSPARNPQTSKLWFFHLHALRLVPVIRSSYTTGSPCSQSFCVG